MTSTVSFHDTITYVRSSRPIHWLCLLQVNIILELRWVLPTLMLLIVATPGCNCPGVRITRKMTSTFLCRALTALVQETPHSEEISHRKQQWKIWVRRILTMLGVCFSRRP